MRRFIATALAAVGLAASVALVSSTPDTHAEAYGKTEPVLVWYVRTPDRGEVGLPVEWNRPLFQTSYLCHDQAPC